MKMAQADSQFTTRRAFLGSPETRLTTKAVISPNAVRMPDVAVLAPGAANPIFTAIDAHNRELDRRNQKIERSAPPKIATRQKRCLASLRKGIDRAAHDQAPASSTT
jgi:hypothetical protein